MAEQIDDAWYKVQALAWAARFAPAHSVEAIVASALAYRTDGKDGYQRAAAAAWPLRALIERDLQNVARDYFEKLLPDLATIQPTAGRSEAIFLIYQAVFSLGNEVRESLIALMRDAHSERSHWRTARNLRAALLMFREVEPERTTSMLSTIADQKIIRQVMNDRNKGACHAPRQFFF